MSLSFVTVSIIRETSVKTSAKISLRFRYACMKGGRVRKHSVRVGISSGKSKPQHLM